jgi:hypothetical protein
MNVSHEPIYVREEKRSGTPIAIAGLLTVLGGLFLSAYGNFLQENVKNKKVATPNEDYDSD